MKALIERPHSYLISKLASKQQFQCQNKTNIWHFLLVNGSKIGTKYFASLHLSVSERYKVGLKSFGLKISWILLPVKKHAILRFLKSLLTVTACLKNHKTSEIGGN